MQVPVATRERYERMQFMLTAQELEALDNFRFKHRLPSRAAAIREALRRGLGVSEKLVVGGSQSADFGLLQQTKRRQRKG
jgi:metal-responsive CopG/Arc/MetJ family transcriptional regulator